MNDPGLEEPIANEAEVVQNKFNDSDGSDSDVTEGQEEIRAYFLPTRWWYASTAFPLMAGTFGPMANTFSVCALVQFWRVQTPPGSTGYTGIGIKDPGWLVAVNVLSLVFAVGANISLLLNMARRVSFSTAQPLTIGGFWLASVLLLILVGLASNDYDAPPLPNQVLTQAYYYAIFAAGLYQIISYLLCVTVWGAYRGHYEKEFRLTMSQRTLMLQTVSFMAYLLVGAAIYARVEGWEYLDAVYWADFTCLTVGIGDYAPITKLGRGLLFPYAIGGIVTLGLVVGSIRSMVLDRGKKKLFARMTEKTRESILKQIGAKKAGSTRYKGRRLPDNVLAALRHDPADSKLSEIERRKAEFDAMRAVQELAARKRKWISLSFSGGVFLVLWFVGALVFYKTEKNQNWTYFDGLYFAYTSLLTIGYGDLSPSSNSGKPFFVFWSLLAVPSLTILISDMGETVIKVIKDLTIYFGEITVLPSDEGGLAERLRFGAYTVTGGRFGKDVNYQKQGRRIKLPGMVNIIEQDEESDPNSHDVEAARQDSSSRENGKQREEQKARQGKDKLVEDQHHYRHILISEVKRMYDCMQQKKPKKFTYDEWAYYLRLLGEDEDDQSYHRRARVIPGAPKNKYLPKEHRASSTSGNMALDPDNPQQEQHDAEQSLKPADEKKAWSWLGDRSPLMGEKDEASWIMEHLLAVLERSLKQEDQKARHERRRHRDRRHSRSGSSAKR